MPSSDLAQRVLSGDRRAAARLMRLLDDGRPAGYDALAELFPNTGNAYIIGITGSPGSGKSTLTNKLVRAFRDQDKTVGVVAIDPTSPFSGGAILGDRIRMQDHEADHDVFVRSLATRGNLGGLSRSTRDVVHVMDAMGKDVILIETVGVGQDEIDVVGTAHTSIVVLVPGMGDDIQAIKAGILEIADLFVINKADRAEVERTEHEINAMIELGVGGADDWRPEICRTIATEGKGVLDLMEAIQRHKAYLDQTGERSRRYQQAVEATFWDTVQHRLMADLRRRAETDGEIRAVLAALEKGELDPYSAAARVVGE